MVTSTPRDPEPAATSRMITGYEHPRFGEVAS
jgi:hypothetical protein